MAQQEKRGFASLLYNRISYLGGMLAAIMIVIFLLIARVFVFRRTTDDVARLFERGDATGIYD